MWKDFFYYTKSERRAVYVLLVLIALLVVAIVVVPGPVEHSATEMLSADSVKRENIATQTDGWKKDSYAVKGKDIPVSLMDFDPNLADSIELVRLGLPPYVVRNVIKYRQKGGRFRTPESFSRIYGLTEGKFEELKPYIRISDSFVPKPKMRKPESPQTSWKSEKKDTFQRQFKYPEGTLLAVNGADTTELKKIPGIGSGISKMIVAYRERLGGFYSLEQLAEVKFVTPELLEWFTLDEVEVRKLSINKASLEELRAHPYINYYQAKVMVEHRRKKGKITSLSQLSLYEEFTEKDLQRIFPYISFD